MKQFYLLVLVALVTSFGSQAHSTLLITKTPVNGAEPARKSAFTRMVSPHPFTLGRADWQSEKVRQEFADGLGTANTPPTEVVKLVGSSPPLTGHLASGIIANKLFTAGSPPVVTLSAGPTQTTNSPPGTNLGLSFSVDYNVKVSDSDSPTLASATITITNVQAQEDVLFLLTFSTDNIGNISSSYNANKGELVLTSAGATATVAQWQRALQNVTYQNKAVHPNTTQRTVSIVVNDGVNNSAVVTKTLIVNESKPTIRDFTATPSSVCTGSSVTFTAATSTVSIPYNYTLTNGVQSVAGTVNTFFGLPDFTKEVTTAGSGTQSFTLTISTYGELITATTNVTVYAIPTVYAVTGGGTNCGGVAVGLSNSQAGTSYQLLRGGSAVGSPIAGTGSVLNFGSQTASGTYTVQATNGGICSQAMSGSAVVTSNPLPMQYSVTGGGTYCTGTSGLVVGLSSSQTGVTYQLLRNGTAAGSALAGTGGSLNFGNQTSAGTYTVQATNPTTTCQQTMTGSATIAVNQSVAITGQSQSVTSVCGPGKTGIFRVDFAGTGPFMVTLFRGNTQLDQLALGTNVIGYGFSSSNLQSGSYQIAVTTACNSVTTTLAPIVVNSLPTPSFSGLASSYCQNATPVSLSSVVSPTGGVFTLDGSPASSFNPASLSVGQHTVVYSYTNSSGCTGTANQTVTVEQLPADYQALADLYASTNGAGWKNKTNWLTGCTPCGWYGVSCDAKGRVTSLGLVDNNLTGTLPTSLSALTFLQSLNLSTNKLSGAVPASLGSLTQLQTLDLAYNPFTGTIPAELSTLTNLQYLALTRSQLTGSIPSSFTALTNLRYLRLQDNQLTGTIPATLSLLTNLLDLNLANNQLTGSIPASLASLTKLQSLDLRINQLSGCLPASLSIFCGRAIQLGQNPNLPGGGDFTAFCASGVGSDAFIPLVSASANPVCIGATISLSVTSGSGYSWNGPNGFTATTQTPQLTLTSVNQSGTYSVTVLNGSSSCSATKTLSLTVNALPTVSIVGLNAAYCQDASAITLTGNSTGGNFTIDGIPTTSFTPTSLSVGQHTVVYSFTNSNGCSNTVSQPVTINALPTPAITGLASAYCQDASVVTLGGTPAGGAFSVDGNAATSFNPASLSIGQHTVRYTYTDNNGCTNSASQNYTIKKTPSAPALVTANGQPYPANVSRLTVSQNTGSVSLAVSGCTGGTITWPGGNSTTLAVSTANLGTQTFQATCTIDGCASPVATATVIVEPTTLSVLYRDAGYGNTQDNIIQPYLQLSNKGNESIPYGDITVRYWFTSEGASPPTNLAVYYAPLGAVQMNYVALPQPRQGATGYVEYSFPGGGSLSAQSNSGPIENGIQKSDRSNFNELDDYSYLANYADYQPNVRITAYRKGADGLPVLFWGQEPVAVPAQASIKVYSAAKDGTITSQIQTRFEVRNEGNTAVAVSDLKVRYYFTSDNNQPANVYVDYADIGASNVQARVVQLPSSVNGADSYVELTFMPGMSLLAPQSSLGAIDFRIVRSDYGLLDQSNDYSYAANYGNVGLNTHITAYLSNNLAFGTPPSGVSARVAMREPSSILSVQALGNPVVGSHAEVEIKGVAGQAVSLQLMDLQGRAVHEQRIEQAGEANRVSLPLGHNQGPLLLKVSTPYQQQSLKLLRP